MKCSLLTYLIPIALLLITAGCSGGGGSNNQPPDKANTCVWGSSTWNDCTWDK